MEQNSSTKRMLVAAIDFGTTYSGAAISFCHEYEKDPTQIHAIKIGNPRMSMKCMTCILIESDGKTCKKFGEDADSYYYEELEAHQREDWYFFKRFKMQLYNVTAGNFKDFELEDETGRRLPALTVFSLAIEYMKDQILEHCNNRIHGAVRLDEIGWVLTVPAIWDDRAKGFMREAAEKSYRGGQCIYQCVPGFLTTVPTFRNHRLLSHMNQRREEIEKSPGPCVAGIDRTSLTIALEPEAASIFCQHIPLVRDQSDLSKLVPFKPGMKYVVLDCGGGTVDITVHEVTEQQIQGNAAHVSYYLKEIHKARGNDMGGTKVDKAFVDYLVSIVSKDVFDKYKAERPEDFWDLMNAFEEKKRLVEKDGKATTMSTQLMTVFEQSRGKSLKDHLNSISNTSLTFPAPGKMRINNEVVQTFFDKSVSSIIAKLQEIFSERGATDCSTILMVGGYSESPLLLERVKAEFQLKKVIRPKEAGLAVLKGAVIFGHNPGAISERICRFTYGTDMIFGRFDKLVEIGDRLEVGKSNRERTYYPVSPFQTKVPVNIFISPKPNPEYYTEEGCVKIMPRTFAISSFGFNRPIKMCMIFGGTEFTVKVKDVNSGNEETFFVSSWD